MLEVISRAKAKSRGLVRYFTGKPCKNGHVCERQTNCGKCFGCKSDMRKAQRVSDGAAVREKERERTKRDKAAIYARNKRWRDANAEKVAAAKRANRLQNIKNISAYYKAWRKQNPEIRSMFEQKRRARKFNATPAWYGELDDLAAAEASSLCRLRFETTGFAWQIDHMVPLQAKNACGLHLGINLQVIPATMNNSKNNKMILTEPGEWLRSL